MKTFYISLNRSGKLGFTALDGYQSELNIDCQRVGGIGVSNGGSPIFKSNAESVILKHLAAQGWTQMKRQYDAESKTFITVAA